MTKLCKISDPCRCTEYLHNKTNIISAVHSKITIKKSSLSLHQKKIVLCTLLTLQPYEYDFVHVQIPKSY